MFYSVEHIQSLKGVRSPLPFPKESSHIINNISSYTSKVIETLHLNYGLDLKLVH